MAILGRRFSLSILGRVASSSARNLAPHGRRTGDDQYTSSGGGGGGGRSEPDNEEVASQFAGADAGGSSSSGRRRPIGLKATKVARARGRGLGKPSQTPPSIATNDHLMGLWFVATTTDVSRMTSIQFRAHCQRIELLKTH